LVAALVVVKFKPVVVEQVDLELALHSLLIHHFL
jgi:hypothetical protein